MSKQVILWRNITALSTTSTAYAGLAGGQEWRASSAEGRHPWGPVGEFSNLEVTVDPAPGAGKSRTFTVMVGGAATALTVTISDTNTTAQLTGTSVAVAAWDQVALRAVPSGTPAATSSVIVSFDFDGDVDGEQGYGLATTGAIAQTRTNRLFFGYNATNWSPTNAQDIVGVAGVINGYGLNIDPVTAVGTWTFVLFKNGVEQNGSGGTVDTRLVYTSGSPAAQQASFSLPVSPGDLMLIQAQETVSATSISTTGLGVLFTATTPGEFMIGASGSGSLSSSVTEYQRVPGGHTASPVATEAPTQVKIGVTPFTLSGFRIELNGTATAYQFTVRQNTAASALTATVSGGTTASDLSNLVAVVPGDLIAMEIVPVGSPTVRVAGWVLAANATPAATGRSWGFVGAVGGPGVVG